MRRIAGIALALTLTAASLAVALPANAGVALPARPSSFTPHTPATAVHTEFTVETNRKGQVTRVRSGKSCPDLSFNAMTYGNALQAFIRTADGQAIPGTYRLSYDYDPRTKRVRRSVALIRAGGVDPNRIGAVDEMAAIARRHHEAAPSPAAGSPLPDFKAITGHKH